MWGNSSRSGSTKYGRLPTDDHDEETNGSGHDGDIEQSSSSQKFMKKQISQQDDQLGILEKSIQKLGALSLSISDEIKHQNHMLEHMEEDVDNADEQLSYITKITKELIKRSNGPQYCAIITILSIILIVLIILVFFF